MAPGTAAHVPRAEACAEASQHSQYSQPSDTTNLQMLRRLGEILLLQWAWLKTWIDLWLNGSNLCRKFDIQFLAPTVVIIVGIVMTNLLGLLNFFQQGLYTDARMAAVDLDTPFLAWKHGSQVAKGEDCPEWEKLRLRNSIWRSLPLAMITFVLSLRSLVEIPSCQMFATFGVVLSTVLPDPAAASNFARDLQRDKLDFFAISRVQTLSYAKKVLTPKQIRNMSSLAGELMEFEHEGWEAAHCEDSRWETATMLVEQDRSQTWLLFQPVAFDKVELGGIGSGNLASTNAVLFEQWLLLLDKMERTLKPTLLAILTNHIHRFAVSVLPWDTVVREAIATLDSSKPEHGLQTTVQQSRPWILGIGDFEILQIASGWKVRVFQTCGLLLVAVLPILKRILAACKVRPGQPFLRIIVSFYTVFDLVLLVTAWLWCAAAPCAHHYGAAGKALIEAVGNMMADILKGAGAFSIQNFTEKFPSVMMGIAQKRGPEFVRLTKETLLPAIKWDLLFFLQLSAGSLVFLAASAVLAFAFCGARFSSGLSAGICGPLWLVSESGGESQVTSNRNRGLYFMMVSRSFLFAGLVVFAWRNVDTLSTQIFLAIIINEIKTVTLWPYWLALCAMHCMCGLLAASAVEQSLEQSTEEAHGAEGLHGEVLREAYGTFVPAKAGP